MQFFNMMTCSGFEKTVGGSCSISWLGLVLAVFIIMVARKWLFETMLNQDLSTLEFVIAIIITIVSYFIVIGISGSFKWATLAAIILGLAAGYFAPMVMGGGGDGGGGSSNNQF